MTVFLLLSYGFFHVLSLTIVKQIMQGNKNFTNLLMQPKSLIAIGLAGGFYILTAMSWFTLIAYVPLTIVYPLAVSIAIIFTTLAGYFIFNERINKLQFLAIIMILFGMYLIK